MEMGRKMTGNKEKATKMTYVRKPYRETCKLTIKNKNELFKISSRWNDEQLILKERSIRG